MKVLSYFLVAVISATLGFLVCYCGWFDAILRGVASLFGWTL